MSDKIKVSMTAVIPTGQYANLQPTVEVEGEDFEEARDLALKQIQSISEMVAEPGKSLSINAPAQTTKANLVAKVCSFTGTKVLMDEAAHTYQDSKGIKYLSGSTFSHRYKAPFDAEAIATKMAAKHEVDKNDILRMWKTNSEASTSFGTAVHAGLELYGKFLNLSMKVKGTNESALHKNPVIREIVEGFFANRKDERALYEAFAVDSENHLCGFIDRLLVVDAEKKVVRVQDYKTNPDINKRETVLAPFKTVIDNTTLGLYWLQLSFYSYILTKAGYTVEGLDIFNYDGKEWVTYSHEVVDVSGEVK